MDWKALLGTIGKGVVEMLPFGKVLTLGLEGIGEIADAVGGEAGSKIQSGLQSITSGLQQVGQTPLPPDIQAKMAEDKNNKEVEMARIAYEDKKLEYDDQAGGRDVIKAALLSDDPLVRQARPKMMLLLGKTSIGYTIGTPVLIAILTIAEVSSELLGLVVELVLWQGATLWSAFTASYTGYTVARTTDKKTAEGIVPSKLLKAASEIGKRIS